MRNLEKASVSTTTKVTVQWEPFFLNQNTPEGGEDLREHIAAKYGPAMAARFSGPDNPLAQAGKKVGIEFNNNRKIIPTVRCHVVVDHVNKMYGPEKGNDLMKVLFRQYFEKGLNVNDKPVLLDCIAEVFGDVARDSFSPLLDDPALADEIRAKDRNVKTRMRVNGVPYFVIGKNAFSGAQVRRLRTHANVAPPH